MTKYTGKTLLLKAGDMAAASTTFTEVGQCRSNSIQINGEVIDVSTKSTQGFREVLQNGGMTSVSIAASGVVSDDAEFRKMMARALSRDAWEYQVVTGSGTYEGQFICTAFSEAGEHNGEQTFDFTLENAGPVTFTPAA